ncbi:hypothetical protein PanWU01x14_104910 [Parasponia andersonii]|uniref:Uncharacterized protein n=1 Tax=Parasponia andersonii TaxID=3476 RepID=A0A2P5D1B4_PARAD|nr:hypothetical protein PanWU01x14_104910 [Parasponia andersonii]
MRKQEQAKPANQSQKRSKENGRCLEEVREVRGQFRRLGSPIMAIASDRECFIRIFLQIITDKAITAKISQKSGGLDYNSCQLG